MRILVHDFAGYSFPVQLGRELASRGHQVTQVYPEGLPGPKGRLARSAEDPELFRIEAIRLSSTFSKYSPVKRFLSQRTYAKDLKALIGKVQPDVVLSGDTPIDIQAELLWRCRRDGVRFVHWVQDVYYLAIHFFLQKQVGALSPLLSFPFQLLEKQIARRSDANVVIAPAFGDLLGSWGVSASKINIIENWAPLNEVASAKGNAGWSEAHGLAGKVVFLYSGTLGFKHRPDLIYKLAESLGDDCRVVVVTEGFGRNYLEGQPKRENLVLMDFQPYECLPEVLASADVLLATLEADAGQFAVPSKILSYLCAGKPILFAAPEQNLAATVVKRSGAGFVTDPDIPETWTSAAQLLASDAELRQTLGRSAREYSERTFDISRIAAEFETVLAGVGAGVQGRNVREGDVPASVGS